MREIRQGQFYRHFKGGLYQVMAIATHSETKEKMVVYQALYGDYGIYVRPYDMFASEVDHEKYPECRQQYRFESVVFQNTSQRDVMQESGVANKTDSVSRQEMDSAAEPVSDRELRKILMNDQGEKLLTGRMADEEIARRGFLALLDADTYREKRQILVGLRAYLNELYLNNLAAAMDIVLEEGSSQEHYDTLLHCLETYEKYEGGRLRR